MKKIVISVLVFVVIMVIVAVTARYFGSGTQVDGYDFDGNSFEYLLTDDEDIMTYRSDAYDMDIKVEEESMTVFFEIEEDIYIVETDYDNINIRKNGTVVAICARDTEECTGFEETGLEDDIFTLINKFN